MNLGVGLTKDGADLSRMLGVCTKFSLWQAPPALKGKCNMCPSGHLALSISQAPMHANIGMAVVSLAVHVDDV